MKDLGRGYQKVERGRLGIKPRSDDNEFGVSREEGSYAVAERFFSGRDNHHDRRVLEVVGGEYESSMAVVAVIADIGCSPAGLDELAFEGFRDRCAPAG